MNARKLLSTLFSIAVMFSIVFAPLGQVNAAPPAGSGGTVFLPVVITNTENAFIRAVEQALARFPYDQGYAPVINHASTSGDWGLGIISLGVSMPAEAFSGDLVYLIGHKENGGWQTALASDANWASWASQAPETLIGQSLREYLLDQQPGLNPASPQAIQGMPELRLPWAPKDNPRRVSGYLYNEGTHTGADRYGVDWGLNHNDVVAVAAGTVTDSVCNLPDRRDDSKGYGNYVQTDIGGVLALYAHLASCNAKPGDKFAQGDFIATSGTSGYSSGPHLHFRIRDYQRNPVLAEPISGYSGLSKGLYYNSNNSRGQPLSCTPGDDQIALYVDGGYTGQCVKLGLGDYANSAAIGLPSDSLSSVQVGAKALAVLCRDDGFNGGCATLDRSTGDMGQTTVGNDQVSSVRVQWRPGQLQVVEALRLSTCSPAIGENVIARFKVRNTGSQALTMQNLTAGGRLGSDWGGAWADFPHVSNITLQPGQEYAYEQSRSFDQAGAYFSEPVVQINASWGGIGGANRVTFSVANTGRLAVVEALRLSNTSPLTGEPVRAHFKLRNVGGQALTIEQLTAGGRKGTDWNGDWADFPSVFNITLQPGQEYAYDQERSYTQEGGYFAEPVVKLKGNWGGIHNANRVTLTVLAAGKLTVSAALNLSNLQPTNLEQVQAAFTLQNTGSRALAIEQLTAGGRKGTDWNGEWADFPSVFNITLQPGQSYHYKQSRAFAAEGGYFAEPVVKINGNWGGIGGANRVTFTVMPGLRVTSNPVLVPANPVRGQVASVTFTLQNLSPRALTLNRLVAASRGPDCQDLTCPRNTDFPVVEGPLTLQPNQTYTYQALRTFEQEGSNYFVEPFVEVTPGYWTGIQGGSQTRFRVIAGGRLMVSQPLALSLQAPGVGEAVQAAFQVTNVGVMPLVIEQLTAGGRKGTEWADEWADFPSIYNITLQPGQSYAYTQTRAFLSAGDYFAEPVVKLAGYWGGIGGANRVSFTVSPGLRIVQNVSLNPGQPQAGQAVSASFRLHNDAGHAITVRRFVVAVRGPNCADFSCPNGGDFPVSDWNLTIQPGQDYVYTKTGYFSQAGGGYIGAPVMEMAPDWWVIVPGGSILNFAVH